MTMPAMKCGKCLMQAFVSSSALHNHKKVCLGLVSRKSTGGLAEEVIAAAGVLPRPPPKRMARLLPLIPRASVPLLLPNHYHTTVDERPPTTTSPTRTQRTWARSRRRRRMQAWLGRTPATRHVRMVATISKTPTFSTSALLMSLNSCILSIKDFVAQLMCLL